MYKYYPKTLPLPLQSSYSVTYTPSVLRTTMTDGTVRQRLLNVGASSTLKCNILLRTQDEYNKFMQFYKDINYGADWFVMPVINESGSTDTAIEYRLIRMQNGKFTSTLQFNNGNAVRQVGLTCDMDELKTSDSEWINYYKG